MIPQPSRSVICMAGLALLCGRLLVPAPLTAEPGSLIEGRGAAGVTEVGRPLDVVRSRAEVKARARAADDLVQSIRMLASGPDRHHTEGPAAGSLDERARSAAAGGSARWHLRYWSNGAVTARVTIPGMEILDDVAADE